MAGMSKELLLGLRLGLLWLVLVVHFVHFAAVCSLCFPMPHAHAMPMGMKSINKDSSRVVLHKPLAVCVGFDMYV